MLADKRSQDENVKLSIYAKYVYLYTYIGLFSPSFPSLFSSFFFRSLSLSLAVGSIL